MINRDDERGLLLSPALPTLGRRLLMALILYLFAESLGFFFLAALAFSVLLIPWIMLRSQQIRPAVTSPDSIRAHFPLVCLIRGAEFLIGGVICFGIALIGLGFLLQINPFQQHPVFSPLFSIPMLVIMLLVGAYLVVKLIKGLLTPGLPILQAFRRVDANSITTFAFIFAAFVAHDVYHFLPPSKLGARDVPPTFGGSVLDRDFLWILVFWLAWFSAKALVRRVLKLN